jgi:DNA topoisomerase-1
LKDLKEQAIEQADPAAVNAIPLGVDESGEPIVVRNGRYGPYVKRGDDTASLPPELPLDELTIERAVELLNAPKGDEPIGTDPATGLPVYAKSGRFGPYVQLGDAETLPDKQKPKMASLFKDMSLSDLSLDDALRLLSLPRVVGVDPADGQEITAQNGRYGPYIKKGSDTRSLATEPELFTVSLEQALALLAEPKRGRGRGAGAAKPPLRELGDDPATGKPMVIKDGRFGPYITDGEYNATVPRSETVESITPERAADLLAEKRAAGPPKKKAARGAKKAAKKTSKPTKATKKTTKKSGD